MIVTRNPLPAKTQEELKSLLHSPIMVELRRAVASQSLLAEQRLIDDSERNSITGGEHQAQVAESARVVHRYKCFLSVLDEVTEPSYQFFRANIEPM